MVTVAGIPQELSDRYSSICKKVPKFLRYEALQQLNIMFIWFYFLLPFFIASLFSAYLKILISSSFAVVLFLLGSALAVYIVYIVQKNVKAYPVDDIEWALYDAIPLYQNLSAYLKEQSEGMKRDYKKLMLKHANRLSYNLQQRWRAGNIKPVRDFEKGSVKKFKDNLRYRIIPTVRDGDMELLKKLDTLLYDFLAYLNYPDIKALVSLNERITLELPNHEPFRKDIVTRLTLSLQNTRIIKHLIALASITGICTVFGYALLTFGNIPLVQSVGLSLTLLGILFGTYYWISGSQGRTK